MDSSAAVFDSVLGVLIYAPLAVFAVLFLLRRQGTALAMCRDRCCAQNLGLATNRAYHPRTAAAARRARSSCCCHCCARVGALFDSRSHVRNSAPLVAPAARHAVSASMSTNMFVRVAPVAPDPDWASLAQAVQAGPDQKSGTATAPVHEPPAPEALALLARAASLPSIAPPQP